MFKSFRLKAKFATLFYAISLSAMLIVGWYGYENAKDAYMKAALDLAKGYTSEVSVHIEDVLQLSHNDLDFIANGYAIQKHAYWIDLGDEDKQHQYHEIVADTLRGFVVSYPNDVKIRIIDTDGHEHVKVRRNLETNLTQISSNSELEDQSQRDFFKQTMLLSKGQVFVSSLDLNTEKGKIEIPHLPIVRLATPLIETNKVKYGIVVVNVLAESFFKYIRDANNNKQERVFYLVAPNGDYLFHPNSEKTFGSLLGHRANFEQDFPNLLAQIKQNKKGVITDANNIVTYQTIYPALNNDENYWLLIGVVPTAFALKDLLNFEYTFLVLSLLVIILIFLSTYYFLGNLMRPLEFVTHQLRLLGRGEVKVEMLAYSGQDELSDMLESTRILVTNMERLAKQADAIGKGDFSGQVEVLSEQDRLGAAINNMTLILQTVKQEDQRRNWLRDGLEQLSKALTGDLNSGQLADISISLLGRYLSAGRGVFYSYNAQTQLLELLGSYMYSERHQVGSNFKLGDGAIGQVARERKPIFLTTVNSDYPPIVTGTSSSAPLYTYTYPLLREEILLGVIELASFDHFDGVKLTFLQEATNTIASFLYTVQQNERIKELLVISESAEKEARDQSKRLQEINAQMEEQQQQLQQQTEELQQTNAQMEEAQQQLQQQNRRLVESQEELDDRAKQLELSSQYKSEFLANMSHELRTPLNSIILLSKMMLSNSEKHLSDDEVHQAEIIHSAGQELLRLINDVLDLSKIEAGQMELHLEKIVSKNFLMELHELFEHSAKEKNLSFELQDNLHGEFISDINRLSQIVRNLLSNALKFTEVGGVSLSISRNGNAKLPIRITVKDTGIGIPEEKRKVIFEAFQQADGSISRQYGGTGLGLSISLRFARLLGGTIELSSVVGQGSEFSLLLPETLSETPSAPAQIEPNFLPSHDETKIFDDRAQLNSQDSVILLIDDDALFGQALLEINRKLDYKTLLATTGKEGLELAHRYQPKGILLDLGLPDMDGTAVLHEIKTQPELADIPVYIVSGREKDAALMQEGILGYLQKPVDDQQIGAAEADLLAFIRQTAAQTVLVVENGGITAEQIIKLVDSHAVSVLKATAADDMESLLTKHPCRLTIIDLDSRSVTQALDIAQRLRQINANMNFVFFGQQTLSDEDEARIYPYSDSIIIKTPQSEQRLLKNIERFLAKTSLNIESKTSLISQNNNSGGRLVGRHILVVDDDARNLFVITAALEKEGAKVDSVLNGHRALEFLEKNSVDMVFMDIMMPEMDGYQTLTALRNNPALAKTPVVALTAKALNTDREKALISGADDYLSKPVDYEVLISMAVVWCAGKH